MYIYICFHSRHIQSNTVNYTTCSLFLETDFEED